MNLTGRLGRETANAYALFDRCGQGLREGGDVKLRGVLVGRIGSIEAVDSDCRVRLDLALESVDEVPQNVGAQIRAKTIFGEKWVELLYPGDPVEARLAEGDEIPRERTIDPLEIETILNVALPLLKAIDPKRLAGALEALSDGFVGHEDAAIRAMESGIRALEPLNDNRDLLEEGLAQLRESGEVLDDIDEDLLEALGNLDTVNRFTTANRSLIESNLVKAPELLSELSTLFETRFDDLTKLVDRGATVIGILSARTGDLDKLLYELPRFNAGWIRNIAPACPYRQVTTEPGKDVGDKVPGRCWRVHNIISESRGPYEPGQEPRPRRVDGSEYDALGFDDVNDVERVLLSPALAALRHEVTGQ